MTRIALLSAGALALAACVLPAYKVSSDAGGSGGSGGAAGAGGAGTTAPDWTSQMTAVWLFDDDADLGKDTNSRIPLIGHFYSPATAQPSRDTDHKTQDQGSAGFPSAGLYMSTSTLPAEVSSATSFTTGAWIRPRSIPVSDDEYVIHDVGPGSYKGGFGFRLNLVEAFPENGMRALCRVGNAPVPFIDVPASAIGPDQRFPEWAHVVCRFNQDAHEVSIFVAGAVREQDSDASVELGNAPGPLMLGCNEGSECDFLGNLDELFFAGRALSNGEILRIYACGIDGARCSCQAASYTSCGLFSVCPSTLPPCNQTTLTGG